MALFGLFKAGAKKTVVEGERGLIMLLEKLGCSDVVDEAQIFQYEDALEQVSALAAKAKNTYDVEQGQFIAIKGQYEEILGEANACQEKITASTTNFDLKGKLEAHLVSLLDQVESMKPELEREEQEAQDALEHYNMLKETVEI